MSRRVPKGSAPAGATSDRLGRDDWVRAARAVLIEKGAAGVRIEGLARRLEVSVGSFYWHWRNRQALLDALVEDWRSTNSLGLGRAIEAHAPNPVRQLEAVVRTWVDEDGYSPDYDAAVRDWARTSAVVADAVRQVDDERIAMLAALFGRMGYDEARAFIRARITYFHQGGYYAMRVVEGRDTRHRLLPLYLEALCGHRLD